MASCGDSVEHLKELLSHNHFIGAFDKANRMVGFSSMNKDGYLHSMFVHKDLPQQRHRLFVSIMLSHAKITYAVLTTSQQ